MNEISERYQARYYSLLFREIMKWLRYGRGLNVCISKVLLNFDTAAQDIP